MVEFGFFYLKLARLICYSDLNINNLVLNKYRPHPTSEVCSKAHCDFINQMRSTLTVPIEPEEDCRKKEYNNNNNNNNNINDNLKCRNMA